MYSPLTPMSDQDRILTIGTAVVFFSAKSFLNFLMLRLDFADFADLLVIFAGVLLGVLLLEMFVFSLISCRQGMRIKKNLD